VRRVLGEHDWVSALAGCPSGEHLAWVLGCMRQVVAPADPTSVDDHVSEIPAPSAEALVGWWHDQAGGDRAVVELAGWRTSRFGAVVVTYRGVDGRLYDLSCHLDPDSGRLVLPTVMRSAGGIDIAAKPVSELTAAEWAEIAGVYETAFAGSNIGHLRRRVNQLPTIAMGWSEDRMVGFSAVGIRQADLPRIGQRSFMDTGVSCVDPSARHEGLSNAIGSAAMQATSFELPNEFALLLFATPITLRAAFRFGRSTWPGTTISEVAAAMRAPTPCQREVGAAIAELFDAQSYDAEHWVLRSAYPLGETTATPVDLEDGYQELFAHVDATRGDALLGLFWGTDPPPQWWE
jgi:hypothetical protein